MHCPNCQTENRDGAKFCDECGFPLIDVVTGEAVDVDDDSDVAGLVDAGDFGDDLDRIGDEAEFELVSPTEEMPVANAEEPQGEEDQPEDAVEAEDAPGEGEVKDEAEVDDANRVDTEGDPEETGDETPSSGEGQGGEDAPQAETDEVRADLSGFELTADEYGERLADPTYEKPVVNWRDGNTIQMKPVDGPEPEKSKDYLASSTTKQSHRGRNIALAVVAIVAVIAAVLFATFQMNLWGGKPVPDVIGMTEADARSVLEGEGFTVRVGQVKSDETEGLVLITDPEAGTHAAEGDEVVVHVAIARFIPEIIGKTKDEAAAALTEEGYENVKFTTEMSEKPEGTVIAVSPEVGSRSKSTAEVVVTLAEPYKVPDVSSMYLDDAIKALEDAGYLYEVAYIPTDDYANGQMMGTVPAAGTVTDRGTVVVIQIAQSIAVMMENSARNYLSSGVTIQSNGYSFIIDSVDTVTYVGGNVVAYTATGRAVVQMPSGSSATDAPMTIAGTLTMSDDGQVLG